MSGYDEEYEGTHFAPKDDELINKYLIRKLKGEACGDFIVHKNVYAKEPWLLDHNKKDRFFKENQWYYFVTRTQVSEKKIDCGKKAKGKIIGDNDGIDRGYWKANAKEDIIEKDTGNIIGVKQTLTFTTSNQKKTQKRGDGTCAIVPGSDSSWVMKEYMLPDEDKFQELVLCKIREKKKSKNKEASSSGLIAAGERNVPMALERCENLGSDELHINAPLVCLGHETSLPIGTEKEKTDWFQYFGLRVEEGQNLLDWCDAIKRSQLS